MKRLRPYIIALVTLAVLLGPAPVASKAQVTGIETHGVIFGRVHPRADYGTLGLNRVRGSVAAENVEIVATVACSTAPYVGVASLTSDHPVTLSTDDDITDGFGVISATDASRDFRGTAPVGGADIRVGIQAGTFHRLLNVVEVDLTTDIRVTGPAGDLICAEDGVPLRVIIILVRNPDGRRYTFIAIFRRHRFEGDRRRVTEVTCGLAQPHSTRISVPGQPGDPLHPCPPEG